MASAKMQSYFASIDKEIARAYDVAGKARSKGYDPEDKVGIPLVKDMAERVEGIISVVAPQIIGSGVSERIKELEEKYGSLDWRISLIIALEIAEEKFCKFDSKQEAIEIGIRAGFAYHTMGVVASPLEGFVEIRIKKTAEGKEYFAISYAGPIRSAGGTGASVSVIIADYVRKKLGYAPYDPTEEEIRRMVTELYDYHDRITNLQYLPSEEEIDFMIRNLSVQIDGDPSERIEVSNYKDLERIETNQIRNGVCLVTGEGLCQKAPKLWKQLSKWGKDFELDQWNFLEEFLALQKKVKAKGAKAKKGSSDSKISPDYTFIKDMVAGRPVFTHPLRDGGFRLRFGRMRTSGYSSSCIHPATMVILNKYLAVGTQLKMERPGKGCTVTPCDQLEGPIVKLKDGSVLQITSTSQAKQYASKVEEILFLGDMLVNYGDFFNRNHVLVPPGYCPEWWVLEWKKAITNQEKLSSSPTPPDSNSTSPLHSPLTKERTDLLLNNALKEFPTFDEAKKIAETYNIPLHPAHTFFWNSVEPEKIAQLYEWIKKGNLITEEKTEESNAESSEYKLVLPIDEEKKRLLELIGLPHIIASNEYVVIKKDVAKALLHLFNPQEKDTLTQKITNAINKGKEENLSTIEIINLFSKVKLRDKSGIFIGCRMGRPEKAKMRKLTGSPQVLFPVGEEGGRFRCFQSALEAGKITADFPTKFCATCNKETVYSVCEICDTKTQKRYYCRPCGKVLTTEECPAHGKTMPYKTGPIDVKHYFNAALKKLNMSLYPDLIKGVKGTSNRDHTPEHIAKGILRAKHDVYVNKDGTTRYDMTQLPVTHFKPKEAHVTVERLKELGYENDIHGVPLTNEDQIVEIKPQDIILPACDDAPDEGAEKVLYRVAKFLDELLQKFYGVESYYNLKSPSDLIGHLVLCLAPHTSAAIVSRIIGFSKTQGFYAHPLIHAATRRDCDGDEACVTLLVDALINFSRKYLPNHRGSTQDAPLVLTSRLTPAEVDDMVFDVDVAWHYPLEFYEACLNYKPAYEVKISLIKERLGKDEEYEGMGFTHDTDSMNDGILCSAYKTLPSMEEKLGGQMDIAKRVRAVDAGDVARLVIEKHFLKDTKGNLRKFTMQQFRCVTCNEKFRRPPLIGKCTACGGKIIFTISEGSVVKYLQPTINLAENFAIPPYLKQTVLILKRRVEGVFGKDEDKQVGLAGWM